MTHQPATVPNPAGRTFPMHLLACPHLCPYMPTQFSVGDVGVCPYQLGFQWVTLGFALPRLIDGVHLDSVLGLAAQQYTTLGFSIFPGASSGSGTVYEDDGATTAYINGESATTTLTYAVSADETVIKISTEGGYPQLPSTRTYEVSVVGVAPPESVTVAGATIPYSRWGGPNTWTYDGSALATIIVVRRRAWRGLLRARTHTRCARVCVCGVELLYVHAREPSRTHRHPHTSAGPMGKHRIGSAVSSNLLSTRGLVSCSLPNLSPPTCPSGREREHRGWRRHHRQRVGQAGGVPGVVGRDQ